jgi:hypothetical protein
MGAMMVVMMAFVAGGYHLRNASAHRTHDDQ